MISLLIKFHHCSLQPTTGLITRQEILFWKCSQRKECSKILKNVNKILQNCVVFSNATGLQSWISGFYKEKRCFSKNHFIHFSVSVRIVSKNVVRASEVWLHFRNVTGENSTFYNSVQKSITYIGMFRKLAFLESSRYFL